MIRTLTYQEAVGLKRLTGTHLSIAEIRKLYCRDTDNENDSKRYDD